jgi:hypothetical protein
MDSIYRWAVLSTILALVVPAWAADDKKEDKDKKPAATQKPDPKDKMISAGKITGKLVRIEAAQKTLAIQVRVPYLNGRNVAYQEKSLEFTAADDMQVLLKNPPVETDEKGRPKKPNPKDLKKRVKGPGGMGYPGDFDSLRTEQMVELYLSKKKDANKTVGRKDKELLEENKPVVTSIYILYEPMK